MNRRMFFVTASAAFAACTAGRAPRLNVFNWDNYVAPDTVSTFEKRFACRVRYGLYASAEEMLAKVMTGNSGWDVVFPSNTFVEHLYSMGLLARLDHARLPLLRNIGPPYLTPAWDPSLDWCVPYMQGATGIVYSKQLHSAPESWEDLWGRIAPHRITMLDDPAEVFAATLKRLGASVNAADRELLTKARDLAAAQKPFLRAYLNEEVRDQVVAGDVLAAQMWTQVAQMALQESSGLAFCLPREGFPQYVDCVAILRESKHPDLAHAFLNYLLEPHVAADIAISISGGTVNTAAHALLPNRLRESPILYPDALTLQRGELFRALPADAQRVRDRYWTEIKSS